MAEGKYGRLFTAEDVELLILWGACLAAHGREGLPEDEQAPPLPRDFKEAREFRQRVEALIEARAEKINARHAELAEDGEEPLRTNMVLTFPPDEPLFLLRGQDVAAPDAIATSGQQHAAGRHYPADYVQACLNRNAPKAHVEAVWAAAAAMRDWQAANPDRVKLPD